MQPSEKASEAISIIKHNIRAAQTNKRFGSPSPAVTTKNNETDELVKEVNRLAGVLIFLTEQYKTLAYAHILDPFSLEYEKVEQNVSTVEKAIKAARVHLKTYRLGTKTKQNELNTP
ncbi:MULTISPECIES: hypothetical protein [Alicyclobacillus]|uniref:Uncharacterized protein n=1 Tax=Alicyclobacillus acidoterrestris (strain ATCC 49025 / DSM 3922 / CIP 106132 / NCIMB 13137 / GD3B) TaxID=1356854 RepID=T0BV21_ALIAG|nr:MULTISPECIES: hypothetical protein [Alicyclobacillus]EPZ44290.1 hypothetical protein N007_11180 [Alicyclobacillus acidoterrestris ATCC 49025]UNO51071.1 hypothetical protein K1I37_21075 [Alicyclobacillus acidoterrestris]GEO27700.1 hypothetical protein AAC03nite_34850 [Alicyclobacillus acidoterrestris]